MKRKSFIAIALVLAVLGLSACEDEVVPDSQFSFNATLEGLSASDDSKVYLLNEQWIYWELGDQISIGSDVYASSNYVGDLINTGAPDWEDFNGVFISSLPWSSKYFVGLYPYSENNQISKSGGAGTSTGFSASIELPSVQSFRRSNAGGHNGDYTFNKNVYPMVALYDGHWDEAAGSVAYNLDFHALAGIVRLQFYDATGSTGKAIRRITVSSPDKQLCGMFNVKEIYTPQPYLEATNNSANRTVTLDCGEDGRAFDSLCSFYLVLPALGNSGTTTSYALSVTLETTDGESCTKNITSVPVRRTGITFMRALSIDSWSPVTASQRLVGNGTKERPYKVYTATDLRYLRDCYNADTVAGTPRTINGRPITGHTYINIMRTDIVLSSSSSDPGYWNFGIKNFVGHMTDKSNSVNPAGITNNSNYPLFASIKYGGEVKGLTVKSSTTYNSTGDYSPFCEDNYGTIDGCVVYSSSVVSSTGAGVAGIAIRNAASGVIRGSHCDGSLSAPGHAVAGVCLRNEGLVSACFASQLTVPAAATVGGVVHTNSYIVSDCYFASNIPSSSSNWGGIVYENGGPNGTVSHCYYSTSGTIITSGTAGGIVHTVTGGSVTECRLEGPINASSAAGIAYTVSGGKVINCYADAVRAAVNANSVGAGIVATLSGGSVENSFVYTFSAPQPAGGGATLGAIVANLNGGTVNNCYSYDDHNLYGATTLAGSDLTAALTRCYLVGKSQVGVTTVTAANAAATEGTAGALVDLLNASGMPLAAKTWSSTYTHPVLDN